MVVVIAFDAINMPLLHGIRCTARRHRVNQLVRAMCWGYDSDGTHPPPISPPPTPSPPPAVSVRPTNRSRFLWYAPRMLTLQWGAVDAEIEAPSVENTEIEGSPFKAWDRSVYSYACYVYCHGVLPC